MEKQKYKKGEKDLIEAIYSSLPLKWKKKVLKGLPDKDEFGDIFQI